MKVADIYEKNQLKINLVVQKRSFVCLLLLYIITYHQKGKIENYHCIVYIICLAIHHDKQSY